MEIIALDGKIHPFRKLPAGYKRMFYIALDIAYRCFFLTNGDRKDIGGIVIIDEIDLHLHPALEKIILRRFTLCTSAGCHGRMGRQVQKPAGTTPFLVLFYGRFDLF